MALDWRSQVNRAKDRSNQVTGEGANKGIFAAYIDSSTGVSQSGNFVYAGGTKSIPLPMPFESNTSWIRAIPESGSPALAGYRSDTQEVVCINYTSTNPKDKLDAYESEVNIYRPLQPGEIEINSAGMAQSYYSQRPVLDQRAGLVRAWLDQDRLEAGAKAPLHSRVIWENESNTMGDEERFGAVRRPYNFLFDPNTLTPRNPLTAILALSLTSSNYFDYPVPNFTLPGPVPVVNAATLAVTQATASNATAAVAINLGQFKKRFFAKEALKILKNPLFPLAPNANLIDFREGQVFDDEGVQTIGSNGAYLRARYKYYSPTLDATQFDIDEVGNVNWQLSIGATTGWNVLIPTGKFSVLCPLQGISLSSGASTVGLISGLSTGVTAGTDFNVDALENVTVRAGLGMTEQVLAGDKSTTITAGNHSATVALNWSATAGVNFTAKATAGKMTLFAPLVDVGFKPTSQMVMGNELNAFLLQLLTAFITAGPALTTGNLGAPTPINPVLLTQLTTLQQLLQGGAAPPQNPWLSKTIRVSI